MTTIDLKTRSAPPAVYLCRDPADPRSELTPRPRPPTRGRRLAPRERSDDDEGQRLVAPRHGRQHDRVE